MNGVLIGVGLFLLLAVLATLPTILSALAFIGYF
jgi:hypothetical protein